MKKSILTMLMLSASHMVSAASANLEVNDEVNLRKAALVKFLKEGTNVGANYNILESFPLRAKKSRALDLKKSFQFDFIAKVLGVRDLPGGEKVYCLQENLPFGYFTKVLEMANKVAEVTIVSDEEKANFIAIHKRYYEEILLKEIRSYCEEENIAEWYDLQNLLNQYNSLINLIGKNNTLLSMADTHYKLSVKESEIYKSLGLLRDSQASLVSKESDDSLLKKFRDNLTNIPKLSDIFKQIINFGDVTSLPFESFQSFWASDVEEILSYYNFMKNAKGDYCTNNYILSHFCKDVVDNINMMLQDTSQYTFKDFIINLEKIRLQSKIIKMSDLKETEPYKINVVFKAINQFYNLNQLLKEYNAQYEGFKDNINNNNFSNLLKIVSEAITAYKENLVRISGSRVSVWDFIKINNLFIMMHAHIQNQLKPSIEGAFNLLETQEDNNAAKKIEEAKIKKYLSNLGYMTDSDYKCISRDAINALMNVDNNFNQIYNRFPEEVIKLFYSYNHGPMVYSLLESLFPVDYQFLINVQAHNIECSVKEVVLALHNLREKLQEYIVDDSNRNYIKTLLANDINLLQEKWKEIKQVARHQIGKKSKNYLYIQQKISEYEKKLNGAKRQINTIQNGTLKKILNSLDIDFKYLSINYIKIRKEILEVASSEAEKDSIENRENVDNLGNVMNSKYGLRKRKRVDLCK